MRLRLTSVVGGCVCALALLLLVASRGSAEVSITVPSEIAEGAPLQYSIQGVAPAPTAAHGDSDGLLADSYQTSSGACPASAADLSYNIEGPVFVGFHPTISLPPGPFSFEEAFIPRQANPSDAEAPDETPAGLYYGCAWIVDNGTDQTLSATQVNFTVREPHFRLSLSVPKRARVVVAHGQRASAPTYTARVWAEVGGRQMDVIVQPRGVRTCPRNVVARLPEDGFEFFGSGAFNRPVRIGGPFTYKFKIGVEKSGRFLVCAAIYDPGNPIAAIGSSNGGAGDEEAATQAWVSIRRH